MQWRGENPSRREDDTLAEMDIRARKRPLTFSRQHVIYGKVPGHQLFRLYRHRHESPGKAGEPCEIGQTSDRITVYDSIHINVIFQYRFRTTAHIIPDNAPVLNHPVQQRRYKGPHIHVKHQEQRANIRLGAGRISC